VNPRTASTAGNAGIGLFVETGSAVRAAVVLFAVLFILGRALAAAVLLVGVPFFERARSVTRSVVDLRGDGWVQSGVWVWQR